MKHYLLTLTIPLLAAAASLSPEGAPEATIDLATNQGV